jgi:hypothetical protein
MLKYKLREKKWDYLGKVQEKIEQTGWQEVRANSLTQHFQDLVLEEKLFTRCFKLPLKALARHCQSKELKIFSKFNLQIIFC